jgi:imidazolonepropionase-like amidohydrolase
MGYKNHKLNGATAAERWRIRAVLLPDGNQVEEWGVSGGILHDRPLEEAETLPGGWLLPGMVDAHAHLSLDFRGTGLPQGSLALIAANLEAQLAAGVTALRDMGVVPGVRLDPHPPGRPQVVAAGRFFAPPGRYYGPLYEGVVAEELIATALTEVEKGGAWVKVIADFPGPDGNWGAPQVNYSPEVLRALVEAVHAAGARVAAHTSGPFVAELVRIGIDSIEHGPAIKPDLLKLMADQGTAWTPTLLTVAGVFDHLAASNGPAGAYARAGLALLYETIPLAAQLGIPILAGTDEGPAGSIAQEVAQLRRFGLTPVQALAAASTQARTYLGLPTFGPGAPADFVTFTADPRENPEVLAKPAAVILGGRRVYRPHSIT